MMYTMMTGCVKNVLKRSKRAHYLFIEARGNFSFITVIWNFLEIQKQNKWLEG